jgi:PAS domain S-box-containing protein
MGAGGLLIISLLFPSRFYAQSIGAIGGVVSRHQGIGAETRRKIRLPSYFTKKGPSKVRQDTAACILVVGVATALYFLVRAQVPEFLPSIAGFPLIRESLDWIYQITAVIVIGVLSTVFGVCVGRGSRWTGPLGLVLLLVAGVSATVYLQNEQGIVLEIVPPIILPALVLIYALVRESLRKDRAMFIKEMALLHKDTLLKTVFENTYDSVLVVNEEDQIVYANSAALGLLGYSSEDTIGASVDDFCPDFKKGDPGRKISHYLRVAKLEEAQIGPHPTAIRRSNGALAVIELTVGSVRLKRADSPLEKRTRDRFLYVCNFWDASIRSELDTIRGPGNEDQVMVNRSIGEFVANMSHELRTPLNAILGFSELLDSLAFGDLSEKQHEYVRDINSSANHLLTIINDILDISKVESGTAQLHEEEVNVAALVKSCVKLIEHRAEQSEVEVRIPPISESYHLYVDNRKLKQVLINLLSNAVKFTPSGGALEVGAAPGADGSFTLWVSDKGIGMQSKDIAIALAPFGQVASGLNRKYEGTGLGLPLANSLVEAHGGKLTIKSRLHIGTTVTVSLPPARVCKPRREPPVQPAEKSAG